MKITVGQLKRIIKEEIIKEIELNEAMTPRSKAALAAALLGASAVGGGFAYKSSSQSSPQSYNVSSRETTHNTNIPSRENIATPDSEQQVRSQTNRANVNIPQSESPEIQQAEEIFDQCSVKSSGPERRELGQRGLNILQNVGDEYKVNADVLRGRLQRCTESIKRLNNRKNKSNNR